MYKIGTITYSVPPIYTLEKGGQGAHDIFQRGGALALDDGACGPLLIQKGGIAKIQFIGTQEVKSLNKPCGHEPYWRLCYY